MSKETTWEPLTDNDRINADSFSHPEQYQEGFIKKIGDTELFYVRNKIVEVTQIAGEAERRTPSKEIFSYFLHCNPDMSRPLLIVHMVYGGIAEQTFAYELTQGVWMDKYKQGELPNYLDFHKEILEDKAFFPHFIDIPTKNPYYKKELLTLSKLVGMEEKIREGNVSVGELESLLAPTTTKIVAAGYKK